MKRTVTYDSGEIFRHFRHKGHGRLCLSVMLSVIAACLVFICGFPRVFADPEQPVRVMCYGDSNTYGFDPDPHADRYPESVRWTGVLQEQLGDGWQIIEEGKNGRTTGYQPDSLFMVNEEGPEDLVSRLEAHQPVDVLIIMLGTNDCIPSYGLSAEEVAAGMEELILAAEAWAEQNGTACPSILLVAPPVMDDSILHTSAGSQEAADYIRKVRKIGDLYRQLAEKHGCLFADARDGIELSSLDFLHLTEKGHAQLAALLKQTLLC